MNIIINIIRGILIGVANIIPGVSGGTMAVSLGIYDKMISAVTGLIKNFKESAWLLAQLFAGMAIGIVGFAYAIEFLFAKYPFPTAMAFIGLIIGGIPVIYGAWKADLDKNYKKAGAAHGMAFLVLFAFALALPLLGTGAAVDLSVLHFGNVIALFFIGMIASATMIVPGVSGSMVLLILGYYTSIVGEITNFLDALKAMDMAGLIHGVQVLMPFGIGVLVGIGVIAKLIEWLFKKYCAMTYSAILGLIIASPFAIFINQYQTGGIRITIPGFVTGVVLLAAGAYVTYRMGKMNK